MQMSLTASTTGATQKASKSDFLSPVLELHSRPPEALTAFSAKDIVDAGFQELVRYGICRPGNVVFIFSIGFGCTILDIGLPE